LIPSTSIPREPSDPAGLIRPRLRKLRVIGTGFLWSILVFAILSWLFVEGLDKRPVQRMPTAVPLSLTALSMILLLLSSRVRSNTLRKAMLSAHGLPVDPLRLFAAYHRATLNSFLMLECAAALGVLVALLSHTAFYGIALCAASAAGMLTRWPNPDDFDRLARGRRAP
jgi:hypothetical protein